MVRRASKGSMKRKSLAAVAACLLPVAAVSGYAQRGAPAPTDRTVGQLETVATFHGPMPTGVTVSKSGRIFVNFPRWGDEVPFTVAELVKGKAVAYPDEQMNDWAGRTKPNPNAFQDEAVNQTHFVSVQSVVVDPADRLWVLDTGAPLLKNTVPGGPKLVCIDLKTNVVVKTILIPPDVAGTNSYLNDVRFDLRVGENGNQDPQTMVGSKPAATAEVKPKDPKHPMAERSGSVGQGFGFSLGSGGTEDDKRNEETIRAVTAAHGQAFHGTAYITDSSSQGPNAIIVVDLATGKSMRRLNQHSSTLAEDGFLMFAEGQPVYQTLPGYPPEPTRFAADGIAISNDGKLLYYCPINSTKLYAVSTDALRDKQMSDAQVGGTVRAVAGKMPSDGLESDAAGNVYETDPVTDSIHRWNPQTGLTETLAHDPRILWPDTMSLASDGYLYFTANQLHRQPTMHNGQDLRVKPYQLFRIQVNQQPVRLQ